MAKKCWRRRRADGRPLSKQSTESRGWSMHKRDWEHEIREQLFALKLSPMREAEIVEELSQHLDDRFRESLASGESEEAARYAALSQLDEHELLRNGLRRIERRTTAEP